MPSDTTPRPPISARRAFLYSLLVPGLGQAKLQRPNAGALFAGIELLALGMATKSAVDLRYAKAHANDSLIVGYEADPSQLDGIKRDSLGAPIPLLGRNYYAGTTVSARRTHFEDWLAALVFNHLFSGADAFVAAQLWDLPGQVSFRAVPRGAGFGVSLPW